MVSRGSGEPVADGDGGGADEIECAEEIGEVDGDGGR